MTPEGVCRRCGCKWDSHDHPHRPGTDCTVCGADACWGWGTEGEPPWQDPPMPPREAAEDDSPPWAWDYVPDRPPARR